MLIPDTRKKDKRKKTTDTASDASESGVVIAGGYFCRRLISHLRKKLNVAAELYVYIDEGESSGDYIDRFTNELRKTIAGTEADYLIVDLHGILESMCGFHDDSVDIDRRNLSELIDIIKNTFNKKKTIIIGSARPDRYVTKSGQEYEVPADFRISKAAAATMQDIEKFISRRVGAVIIDTAAAYRYRKRDGYLLNEHTFEDDCYKATAKAVIRYIGTGTYPYDDRRILPAGKTETGNISDPVPAAEPELNDIAEPIYGKPLLYQNEIPLTPQSYNLEEAQDTIEKVKSLLSDDTLCFICVTDIHYRSRKKASGFAFNTTFERMIANMRHVLRELPCEFIINLGDDTDGNFKRVGDLLEIEDYMNNRMLELGKTYYRAIGNHDTNCYGTLIDVRSMYRAYCSHIPLYSGVKYNRDSEGTEYYVDYDKYGVRLLVLNTMYGGPFRFSESTGRWLETEALDTDNMILLCDHLSPVHTMNMNAKPLQNREKVIEALTGVKDRLIQICGHSHCDYSFTDGDETYSPWLTVFSNLQRCSRRRQRDIGDITVGHTDGVFGCPQRKDWTVSEDCWDVVVLNPSSGRIDFVRFGAGEDREFTFVPHLRGSGIY